MIEDDQDEMVEEKEVEIENNVQVTRSGRVLKKSNMLIPSFTGKKYAEIANLNIHITEVLEYDNSFVQVFKSVIDNYLFPQYDLKNGLEIFCEKGRLAVLKEWSSFLWGIVLSQYTVKSCQLMRERKY